MHVQLPKRLPINMWNFSFPFLSLCFQSFHFWSRLVWKYISLRLASLNSAGIYSPETLKALLDADVQRQRILSTSLLFSSIPFIIKYKILNSL